MILVDLLMQALGKTPQIHILTTQTHKQISQSELRCTMTQMEPHTIITTEVQMLTTSSYLSPQQAVQAKAHHQ